MRGRVSQRPLRASRRPPIVCEGMLSPAPALHAILVAKKTTGDRGAQWPHLRRPNPPLPTRLHETSNRDLQQQSLDHRHYHGSNSKVVLRQIKTHSMAGGRVHQRKAQQSGSRTGRAQHFRHRPVVPERHSCSWRWCATPGEFHSKQHLWTMWT